MHITILFSGASVQQSQISYPAEHNPKDCRISPRPPPSNQFTQCDNHPAMLHCTHGRRKQCTVQRITTGKSRCLLRLSRQAPELQSCKHRTRAVLKNTHAGFVKLDSFVLFCQIINCCSLDFKSRSFRLSFICSNNFVRDKSVEDRNNKFSAETFQLSV